MANCGSVQPNISKRSTMEQTKQAQLGNSTLGQHEADRYPWMDFARVCAILLVVLIHTADTWGARSAPLPHHSQLLLQFLHGAGRLGVPIFLMLTGALILPKAAAYPLGKFYLRRIPQFAGLIFFYAVAYAVFIAWLHNQPLPSVGAVVRAAVRGNAGGAYHLWYLYEIISLYLIMPFLGRMVVNSDTRVIWAFVGFALAFASIPPTLWALTGIDLHKFYPVRSEGFAIYPAYILVGYLVHARNSLGDASRLALATGLIGTLCALAYAQTWLIENKTIVGDGVAWYDSLFVFVGGVCVFSLLRHFPASIAGRHDGVFARAIGLISASSFGIYLLHLAVLMMVISALDAWSIGFLRKTAVTVPIVFLVTWGVTELLRRVPVVRKLVV